MTHTRRHSPSLLRRAWRRLRSRRDEPLSPAEGYRRWAADYGHQPNVLQQLEAEALAELLGDVRGHRVLDLGCGKGRAARLALDRGARWAVAADPTFAMLTDPVGFQAPDACRLRCDARLSPFRDHSFDTVICALVLGHLPDLAPPLGAMARALRPGGRLLLTDFHPFATLKGWERTFADPSTGASHAIVQHLHLFEDYMTELRGLGFRLEALREPRCRGFPVVFALRAVRSAE